VFTHGRYTDGSVDKQNTVFDWFFKSYMTPLLERLLSVGGRESKEWYTEVELKQFQLEELRILDQRFRDITTATEFVELCIAKENKTGDLYKPKGEDDVVRVLKDLHSITKDVRLLRQLPDMDAIRAFHAGSRKTGRVMDNERKPWG